ncbi:MAG: metallophosphoesterase, partial [Bacteroidota bacterium]
YWEAKLTGLQQNTVYSYRIGSAGDVNTFRTPPLPGSGGFRVCTTSDMHDNSSECVAMFDQIAGFKPDLVLTTGDVTGAGPSGQQKVTVRFHDAMVWSQSSAWMPVEGNHDWEYTTADDLRTYKGRFDIPNPGTIPSSPAVSCCSEDWGWFDYGNTRFISYPERWTSSSWSEWKTQALGVFSAAQQDPNIAFIVTFGHRSAYTSTYSRSPGESSLRSILDGIHIAYSKYVLDLSGHNHQYERYQLQSGMNYIVNSTTGSYYHNGWASPNKPAGCAYRAIHYGILVLDISENTIEGQFVCSVNTANPSGDYMPLEEPVCSNPGSVIDAFTIMAATTTAVPALAIPVSSELSITNYPNPFNPSTTIAFSLPQRSRAKIVIYDLLGRALATLLDEVTDKGAHAVDWQAKDGNGNDVASGIYIARIQSDHSFRNARILLLR